MLGIFPLLLTAGPSNRRGELISQRVRLAKGKQAVANTHTLVRLCKICEAAAADTYCHLGTRGGVSHIYRCRWDRGPAPVHLVGGGDGGREEDAAYTFGRGRRS